MEKRLKYTVTKDTKVGELVEKFPVLIEVLAGLGFAPVKNPVARKTVAKFISLEQAASFRSIGVNSMLDAIKDAVGDDADVAYGPDACAGCAGSGIIPDYKGDISLLAVVPCPLRNILVERVDSFAMGFNKRSSKTLSWRLTSEGTASDDVMDILSEVSRSGEYGRFPDIFTAIGKDIFLNDRYGGNFHKNNIWRKLPRGRGHNSKFDILCDPDEKLRVIFTAYFVLSCREEKLRRLPSSWLELTDPAFKGKVELPSLDLPIIPDLLGTLYSYYGEDNFRKFAANFSMDRHPSRSAGRNKEEHTGIFILPYHFARLSESAGAKLVIPADGVAAVSAYIAAKESMPDEGMEVVDYFSSKDYLEPFFPYAGFIPNNTGLQYDFKDVNLVVRPWGDVNSADPKAGTERLLSIIKGETP